MSIKVRRLEKRLREVATLVLNEDPEILAKTGALSLLLEEASDVIKNQQDDLEALRQQGTDHG